MAKTVYKLIKTFNGKETFSKIYEDKDEAYKQYDELEFQAILDASDTEFYEVNRDIKHEYFDIISYNEDKEYNHIIKLEEINLV